MLCMPGVVPIGLNSSLALEPLLSVPPHSLPPFSLCTCDPNQILMGGREIIPSEAEQLRYNVGPLLSSFQPPSCFV